MQMKNILNELFGQPRRYHLSRSRAATSGRLKRKAPHRSSVFSHHLQVSIAFGQAAIPLRRMAPSNTQIYRLRIRDLLGIWLQRFLHVTARAGKFFNL